jgi:AcrR family transcriptional regulator
VSSDERSEESKYLSVLPKTKNTKANSLSFLYVLWDDVNGTAPLVSMPLKNQVDTPHVEGETSTSARRLPVQSRSQHTVQRVLDAASSLLEQTPLEAVTTTRIAAEAGLSIGALYRFFPDKQTIIDAIAVRHVEQFRASLEASVMKVLERELANLETFDPAKVLDSVVDAYIVYLDAHPDFQTISFGRYISAATKEREASPSVGLPALLKNFMLERLGIPNTPELDLMLRMVSEAGERLIAYAYEQPTREDRDRVIAEMKRMLAGYLFPADAAISSQQLAVGN